MANRTINWSMFAPCYTLSARFVERVRRMHVIEHYLGKRIHVPIQAESVIGRHARALGRQVIEHVDVREAISHFPCAAAGVHAAVAGPHAEKVLVRSYTIEHAHFPVVRPILAGEKVADIGIRAVEVIVDAIQSDRRSCRKLRLDRKGPINQGCFPSTTCQSFTSVRVLLLVLVTAILTIEGPKPHSGRAAKVPMWSGALR